MPFTLVAKLITGDEVPAKDGDDPLSTRQMADPDLRKIMAYLKSGILPEDKQRARELILHSAHFTLLDGVLYHLEKDKTLRVVPPVGD